jgi:hypothetical protein
MSIKKYLVVRPKYGLCNQLYSISKGIIYGIISNRDIIFSGFQIDYRDEDNLWEFSDIININDLQDKLKKLNLKINISSDLNIKCKKINTLVDEKISNIKDFVKILFYEENINEDFLDIDNPISSSIPEKYNVLYKFLNINIKFVDKYINMAHEIKNNLNLKDYVSIHLRLEDDAINFMIDHNNNTNFENFNNICKNKYLEELEKIREKNNNPIYICTSLIVNNNINNDFYKEIKEKYNCVDKNMFITNSDYKCRELYGILDYIIAKDSQYFIGCDWSSFSYYIVQNHLLTKKEFKLIDIYETVKKL